MDKLDDIGFKVLGTRDYSKLFLWIPKAILKPICMWPGPTYCPRYIFIAVAEIFITLLGAGVAMQCIYILTDVTDIFFELVYGVGMISGVLKYLALFVHRRKLEVIVEDVMTNFWPSDLVNDDEVKKELKTFHSTIIWILVYLTFLVVLNIVVDVVVEPIIFGGLPLPIYVPVINYLAFPYFEIIYIFELFTMTYMCNFVMMGFDFCFVALCSCVVSQFKLCCNAIITFNTPQMFEVNAKLREMDRKNGKHLKYKYNTVHDEFFARCVQHHQLLLRSVDLINEMCSLVELVQTTFTITGICSGLFILTTMEDRTFTKVFFVLGVILFSLNQLFLYCAIGNELYYQASLLPEFIFKAKWYEMENTKYAKSFTILLHRSQDIPEITSYNLYSFNLDFYVRVIKFAFSMYTFLTTMQEKSQQ